MIKFTKKQYREKRSHIDQNRLTFEIYLFEGLRKKPLYALDFGNGGIDMFQIERDGSLTDLGTVPERLSMFAQGIASR